MQSLYHTIKSTVNSVETSMENYIVGSGDHAQTEPEGWMNWERTVYTVSLGYNLILKYEWWNEINDSIILGALPFQQHVQELQQLGVSAVLTLNKGFELQPSKFGTPATADDWNTHNIAHLHIVTPDFHPPSIEELLKATDFMRDFIQQKKKVYVHCKAGRGRSVVATVCYLIRYEGMTTDEAIAFVTAKRPQVNMGTHQKACCYQFFTIYGNSKEWQVFSLVKLGLEDPGSSLDQLAVQPRIIQSILNFHIFPETSQCPSTATWTSTFKNLYNSAWSYYYPPASTPSVATGELPSPTASNPLETTVVLPSPPASTPSAATNELPSPTASNLLETTVDILPSPPASNLSEHTTSELPQQTDTPSN